MDAIGVYEELRAIRCNGDITGQVGCRAVQEYGIGNFVARCVYDVNLALWIIHINPGSVGGDINKAWCYQNARYYFFNDGIGCGVLCERK